MGQGSCYTTVRVLRMRGVEMAFSGMKGVLVVQIMKEVGSVIDALGRKQKL